MLGIHDLALFVVSGLLLNMMPGPDSLLHLLRSGSQGWRAGSVAALGIGTGTMVHVLAAALGLSALLSAFTELFAVIKLMGALYLVYLGGSLLWQGAGSPAVRESCGCLRCFLLPDLPARVADQCAQSQGSPVLPRLCSPVHRSRCTAEGASLHRAGLYLQFQRHDLVPSAGLLDRLCEPQDGLAWLVGPLAQPPDGRLVRGAWHQAGRGVRG